MTREPTRQQLAHLAEARIWRILLETDEQISGLEPSRVRDLSQIRLTFLESTLADFPEGGDELLEYSLSTEQRDQAFVDAASAMRDVLTLIASGGERHGLQPAERPDLA